MNDTGHSLLPELKAALAAHGYFAAYSLLGDGNVRAWDWNQMRAQLNGPLLTLWDFFLNGAAVNREVIEGCLPDGAVKLLLDRGIARATGEKLSLGGYSLISYAGHAFFIDRTLSSRAFFGEETKALMSLLPLPARGLALSLFTSCGVELLRAVAEPGELRIGESHCEAAVLSSNLELNGARNGHPRRSAASILREPKARFDRIIANGLGFIEPPGVRLPRSVSGGPDGHRRLASILKVAAKTLTDDGELSFVTLRFGTESGQQTAADLAQSFQRHGLACQVYITGKYRLEPWIPIFGQMVGLAVHGKKMAAGPMADRFLQHFEKRGVNTVYLVKGRAARSDDAWHGHAGIFDFSDAYYGSWTF
jgi:hypothetical protein